MKINYNIKLVSIDELMNHFEKDFVESLCKQCPNYSKIWSCPEFNMNTAEYLTKYKFAYIIGAKLYYEDCSDSFDSSQEVNHIINTIYNKARHIFDKQLLEIEKEYPNTKALYAGRCLLCDKCARVENKPCRNYGKLRYSLEALGINVSSITENVLSDKILWSNDNRLPEYCLLIGGLLSDDPSLNIVLS